MLFVVQHFYFCQVQAIVNCALPPLLTIGKNLPMYLPFYSEIFGKVNTSFLLTRVVVDPESNKTFSYLLDLTAPMLSATMMVTGVEFPF